VSVGLCEIEAAGPDFFAILCISAFESRRLREQFERGTSIAIRKAVHRHQERPAKCRWQFAEQLDEIIQLNGRSANQENPALGV
jgi:hypothetical protein